MPYVDPDELLDPPCNDIVCDRCGSREHSQHSAEIQDFWRYEIFHKLHKDFFHTDVYCKKCAIHLTPYVYRMKDIRDLSTYVNKLERNIREKRIENNRATSYHVSKCSQSSVEWGLGNQQS
jgi:hypothetical protein